ncbi:hypothetical protein P8C59_006361 [Phyllachora maydis]|uniref:Sof1-like protein domain-containing protein n=1 Tax=Phyllachora maydis TaxID=1825666 RepID=A0AAD9I7D4_9PEZI|nr:hypothetical protein P8C59_006361 [Phyllachora maydis]
MKIKTLTRTPHQNPGAAAKQERNLRPEAHPFERAREYKRALNAVKLERLFAAPFIGQLGRGHVEGVYSMAKDPNSLKHFASGSGDGVVKVWDLTSRDEVFQTSAHQTQVKGLSWTHDQKLLSCGADRYLKLYDPYNTESGAAPISHWTSESGLNAISMHRTQNAVAAAASGYISIYNLDRQSAAPERIQWPNSTDTVTDVAINQLETSLLASTATDRSIIIADLRTSMPVHKTILKFASNRVSWNPMEAFNLAVANEDHNVYIFDVRKFSSALNILKGHVHAVMDVEWSPTGQELVTGSYDRTVRLFRRDSGHSRDIYHTKRMQRVFRTCFTPDSKYIISGSDDGNLRLWRAEASSRSGVQSARQRISLEYNKALVDRYAHMPEIRRIKNHRHVPKVVKKAGIIKKEELAALKRREENERKHSAKGQEKRRPEREKVILANEKGCFRAKEAPCL